MISGIILASGFSSRMGRDKLLMTIGDTMIIERVIQAAMAADLDEVILVYRRHAVRRVAERYTVKTVENTHAAEGQSASVKAGIKAAAADTRAFLFMVGDQPLLDAATINSVIHLHRENPTRIILPTYLGKRGNPVLFPSSFRKQLQQICGDKGGISVIKNAPDRVHTIEIDSPHIGQDVDTVEDFKKMNQLGTKI